jgi:hypothetical protein
LESEADLKKINDKRRALISQLDPKILGYALPNIVSNSREPE